MAGIQDFIQTFMAMKQLNLQVEAQRFQEEQGRSQRTMSGISTLLQTAQSTDNPVMLDVVARHLDSQGILDYGSGKNILAAFTPGTEVQRAAAVKRGVDRAEGRKVSTSSAANVTRESAAADAALTGMNPQQLAVSDFIARNLATATGSPNVVREAATRALSGMGTGDVALSATLGTAPQGFQDRRAGIAAGTEMSAAQDASNQANWAGVRLQGQQIAQQGAIAEMNAQVDAATRGSAGKDPATRFSVLNGQKIKLMQQMMASKDKMTPAIYAQYKSEIDGINAQLRGLGVSTEGPMPNSADQMFQTGWFKNVFNAVLGRPSQ